MSALPGEQILAALGVVDGRDPRVESAIAVLGFHNVSKRALAPLTARTLVDVAAVEKAYDGADYSEVAEALHSIHCQEMGHGPASAYGRLVVEDWRERSKEASGRLVRALVAKGVSWPNAVARVQLVAGVPLEHLGRFTSDVSKAHVDRLSAEDAADRAVYSWAWRFSALQPEVSKGGGRRHRAGVRAEEFDESEHPRSDDGRFTFKAGGAQELKGRKRGRRARLAALDAARQEAAGTQRHSKVGLPDAAPRLWGEPTEQRSWEQASEGRSWQESFRRYEEEGARTFHQAGAGVPTDIEGAKTYSQLVRIVGTKIPIELPGYQKVDASQVPGTSLEPFTFDAEADRDPFNSFVTVGESLYLVLPKKSEKESVRVEPFLYREADAKKVAARWAADAAKWGVEGLHVIEFPAGTVPVRGTTVGKDWYHKGFRGFVPLAVASEVPVAESELSSTGIEQRIVGWEPQTVLDKDDITRSINEKKEWAGASKVPVVIYRSWFLPPEEEQEKSAGRRFRAAGQGGEFDESKHRRDSEGRFTFKAKPVDELKARTRNRRVRMAALQAARAEAESQAGERAAAAGVARGAQRRWEQQSPRSWEGGGRSWGTLERKWDGNAARKFAEQGHQHKLDALQEFVAPTVLQGNRAQVRTVDMQPMRDLGFGYQLYEETPVDVPIGYVLHTELQYLRQQFRNEDLTLGFEERIALQDKYDGKGRNHSDADLVFLDKVNAWLRSLHLPRNVDNLSLSTRVDDRINLAASILSNRSVTMFVEAGDQMMDNLSQAKRKPVLEENTARSERALIHQGALQDDLDYAPVVMFDQNLVPVAGGSGGVEGPVVLVQWLHHPMDPGSVTRQGKPLYSPQLPNRWKQAVVVLGEKPAKVLDRVYTASLPNWYDDPGSRKAIAALKRRHGDLDLPELIIEELASEGLAVKALMEEQKASLGGLALTKSRSGAVRLDGIDVLRITDRSSDG